MKYQSRSWEDEIRKWDGHIYIYHYSSKISFNQSINIWWDGYIWRHHMLPRFFWAPKKHRIAGWWNFLNHIRSPSKHPSIKPINDPIIVPKPYKNRSWSRIEAYQFILNHQHSENAGTPGTSHSNRPPLDCSWIQGAMELSFAKNGNVGTVGTVGIGICTVNQKMLTQNVPWQCTGNLMNSRCFTVMICKNPMPVLWT